MDRLRVSALMALMGLSSAATGGEEVDDLREVLDPRRLEVPGRNRLEIDHGNPIREIIA